MRKIISIILTLITVVLYCGVSVEASGTEFELPIGGSTGFASTSMTLTNKKGDTIGTIVPGTAFMIYKEYEDTFCIMVKVEGRQKKAYVTKDEVLINLPDIIPSIVYADSNAKESLFVSSGEKIPGVTGEKLYEALYYNARLQQNEYVMPVLYPMAYKIMKAQEEALKNGDSLKIYETYRPQTVQDLVYEKVSKLMNENTKVYNGINVGYWTTHWFIAKGKSTHQTASAIDVSLVKIKSYEERTNGKYSYKRVTEYEEYSMPTQMHELSAASATFTYGVNTHNATVWKWAEQTQAFKSSTGAQKLQQYCTNAGMTPLASEWWHFNDLDAEFISKCQGDFTLDSCESSNRIW